MGVVTAEVSHVDKVTRLFDLYHQFNECNPGPELARKFIGDRIKRNELTIFTALENNFGCGLVQLYPSFYSVEEVKLYVLYDLYEKPGYKITLDDFYAYSLVLN